MLIRMLAIGAQGAGLHAHAVGRSHQEDWNDWLTVLLTAAESVRQNFA